MTIGNRQKGTKETMSPYNYRNKIIFLFFFKFQKVGDIVAFLLGSPINATKHLQNVSLLCPFYVSLCLFFKNQ